MVGVLSKKTIIISVLFWIGIIFSVLYIPYCFKEKQRTIHVCLGAGVLNTECFRWFERETGIRVLVSYCETSEELFSKMIATKGQGYDLIALSDYIVPLFKEYKLLKKIDKTKLSFWNMLNKKFLAPYYDSVHDYTIPAEWYAIALGINTRFFTMDNPELSWDLLFHKKRGVDRIGIINDPHALYAFIGGYLYGFKNTTCVLRPKKINKIHTYISFLKNKIEAYTDYKADLLLFSENCAATMIATTQAWKYLLKKPHIKIGIPKEGTFLHVENYALSAHTGNDDLVYLLLNFLFRYDVQKYNFEYAGLLSTRCDADFMFNAEHFASVMPFIRPDTDLTLPLFYTRANNAHLTHFWLSSKSV